MADNEKDYEGFYEMVRHWVVFDHYNPSVRSEMVWDMLLSDFVCDLMRSKYDPEGTGKEVVLLAKEFPYSKEPYLHEDDEALRGPKVDYLVGVGEDLYFVELKTTPGSYDKEQYDAYMRYVNSDSKDGFAVEDLWDRYSRIAEYAGSNKPYHEYAGSKKYRFQLDKMKEAFGPEATNDDNGDTFLSDCKVKYKRIRLTYITLEKIPGLDDDRQIILYGRDGQNGDLITEFEGEDDTEKNMKRNRWSMVCDIIREAMEG